LVEIAVVLYYHILNIRPEEPNWPERDRVVLSKGHGAACIYAILAARGFFPRQWLWKEFIRSGRRLPEHPDMRNVPGIDISTGSLGQGISGALGMAWAARHLQKNFHVYALMGCGEQQEGQVWEAAMAASHHRLGNLTAIIDYNNRQVSGLTSEVLDPAPLEDKYRAFGWHVGQVDGHDIEKLIANLQSPWPNDRPRLILARTVKGKGISFMEGDAKFHATSLNEEQYLQAAKELGSLAQEVTD
jgi:transketolase